jgi:uroporphyrinogen-III synthase
LLLTRPAEEAGRTAAAAEAAGFATLLAPLLQVVPLDWTPPPDQQEALLFTSARTPGLVAARAPGLVGLPVYAVGPRTGEAASAAGFSVVAEGAADGSTAALLAAEQGVRRLLHLGGKDRAPFMAPPGVEVAHIPVYAARRVAELSADARWALGAGQVLATLLFSARTARHFSALVEGAGIARKGQRIVVMSPAVAAAAGLGWGKTAVAPQPDLPGMLAAAKAVWQGSGYG